MSRRTVLGDTQNLIFQLIRMRDLRLNIKGNRGAVHLRRNGDQRRAANRGADETAAAGYHHVNVAA